MGNFRSFFLRSKARGRGLTHRLVEAGLAFARENDARLVEACPIDQSNSSHSVGLFVGSTRVFEKAGFRARRAQRRAGRWMRQRALNPGESRQAERSRLSSPEGSASQSGSHLLRRNA